jgi:hypothetical protein
METYYKRNRNRCLQYGRQYYQQNKDRAKQYNQHYYKAHKPQILRKLKARCKKTRDSYQTMMKYYLKRLMKLPNALKRKKKKIQRKRNITKRIELGLTVYFD